MHLRRDVALVGVAAVLAACTPDGGEDAAEGLSGRESLTPAFAPAEGGGAAEADAPTTLAPGAETTVAPPAGGTPGTTTRGAPGAATAATTAAPAAPGATSPGAPASSGAPGGAAPTTSSTEDPVGDPTEATALTSRPSWADLAGASLTIGADGVELRIRLADQVPMTAPDADHTMNIASFYDVDGDGFIDYEVWVNLADDGWGPAYFDNVGGTAEFADDAGVAVEVAGDELVVRFPSSHVGGATVLRWSLASEWGRYEGIGSPTMAGDDAPDADRAVTHPT